METRATNKKKPLKMHLIEMAGLMVRIKKTRLPISNAAYNRTIDTGIASFITSCGKDESVLLSPDYPLFERSMLHGVMGVKAYLLNMYNENVFCNEYADDIEWIYTNYCRSREKDPENDLFNFYTQVYINALFCDFLVKDYGTLRLTSKDCKAAQSLLGGLTDEARYDLLFNCAKHFTYGNLAYNNKTFDKVFDIVLNAVKHKNIDKIVVVEEE